jgi:uncharacterized protein
MMNVLLGFAGVLLLIYLLIGSAFYVFQERLIFYPQPLPADYRFSFSFPAAFEELFIPAADGTPLHGLLFRTQADSARGLIFYLHGNAGALNSWGEIAPTYTRLHYDIFILDYRGFGKSGGSISSEEQFYRDVQTAYAHLAQRYAEEAIVVIGYSIGTAAAARVAATNHPARLILQAPYYSLTDLMQNISPVVYSLLPGFLFKYQFSTYQFVEQTKAPITIFHGDRDRVIYHGSATKLQAHLKPTDEVIILPGQGHNGMNSNPDYVNALRHLLTL